MMRMRRPRSSAAATRAVELAFAVPEVMAHRLTRLAFAGPAPSIRDRREFSRMGSEKVAAIYESWNAMLMATFRANLVLTFSVARWWLWPSSFRALPARARRVPLIVVGRGLAPVHRRVVANARRLRRARR